MVPPPVMMSEPPPVMLPRKTRPPLPEPLRVVLLVRMTVLMMTSPLAEFWTMVGATLEELVMKSSGLPPSWNAPPPDWKLRLLRSRGLTMS